MDISPNVDDLLIQNATGKPPTSLPDQAPVEVPRETAESMGLESPAEKIENKAEQLSDNSSPKKEEPVVTKNEYGDSAEPSTDNGSLEAKPSIEVDEYGLEVEAPKSYSKAEMDAYANQIVRERLARLERNQQQHQPTQQQQQHAQQQGFEFNENSNLDWQQQLEQFVMQVADRREQTRAAQVQQAIEQQRMHEFESKFKQGMDKFKDYHEVVGGKNITDAMVMGARGIKDPASFFYAAAKRAPDELAKISQEPDPYAQAAAIGRLDAMLRKQQPKASNAPKPVSQTKADTTAPSFQPKQSSGNELDDLLVQDKNNRLAQLSARRR